MPGKRHTLSHPVVNARLSQLRLTTTNAKDFREGIHDISFILGVEASRDLEQEPFHGQTPVGPFTGTVVKPRIGLTPILRAGLGMADALLKLFPAAPVYHLGLFREKVSLQPVEYYPSCHLHRQLMQSFSWTRSLLRVGLHVLPCPCCLTGGFP